MATDITSNLFNDISKLIESAKIHVSKEFDLTFANKHNTDAKSK